MEAQYLSKLIQVTQPQLKLANPYHIDSSLKQSLSIVLSPAQLEHIDEELNTFGQLTINELHHWALEAERIQPTLVQQTVYGEEISHVHTSEGWRRQKDYAAKEGIVARAYEVDSKFGDRQRFIQLVRLLMYQPSSGLYGCPLAMTDGAAYLFTRWLKNPTTQDEETITFVKNALANLTSRDPQKFWTSGQWMTEKLGGSDVSNATQTIAIHKNSNTYKLYGYKWFTSATDSDITVTLARIVKDASQDNSKVPLSLFVVKLRDQQGNLNNLKIKTLKDKLGTRQLPTGEIILDGTEAYLISEEGKGVRGISDMLNVTRMYNAASAVGGMRRIYQIVLDYSLERKAFGKFLWQLPAHQTLLTQFRLNVKANTVFYLKMAQLFSKVQYGTADDDERALFRMMTPLLKLYTAKACLKWTSEGIEALGALGYMENSNVPVMIRDAQVLTIWEGTTNILSLDFVRALKSTDKDPLSAINVYARHHTNIMMDLICADSRIMDRRLSFTHALAKLTNNHNTLITKLSRIVTKQYSPNLYERRIREIAIRFTENFIGLQLLDLVIRSGRQEDVLTFELWVEQMQVVTTESLVSSSSNFNDLVLKDLNQLQQQTHRPRL